MLNRIRHGPLCNERVVGINGLLKRHGRGQQETERERQRLIRKSIELKQVFFCALGTRVS